MRFLRALKAHWRLLSGISVWIFTIVGTFLVPPVYASAGAWEKFGRFVVAFVAGVLLFLFSRWKTKKHIWLWFAVSVVAFLLGCYLWVGYTERVDQWTVEYDQTRVVSGEHMFQEARNYQMSNGFTVRQLVMDYAGATERIWPETEMAARRSALSWLYLLSLSAISVAIMTLVKALDCITSRNT